MKKLFYSLFLMAIAAMTFTSCENVPEPYDNPNGNKEKPTPGAKIEPAGKGTEADPYNVAAAMQLLKAAKADEPTAPMYVRGKIVEIQGVETKTYGNANYYIADSKDATQKLYIFQSLYLGKKRFTSENQIKVGDDVVVYGPFVNFKGNKPETVGKGATYIHMLNGQTSGGETPAVDKEEGDGTAASPFNVAAALAKGNAKNVYTKGFIVGYIYGKKASEGAVFNADTCTVETNVLIATNANETKLSKCIAVQLPKGAVREGLNLKAHKQNYKQEVVLYGDIDKYFGMAGIKNLTYAKLGTKEFGTKPGTTPSTPAVTAKGTGTLADPFNAVAAKEAASKLGKGKTSATDVYIKGKISSVKYTFSAKYGTATFNISDDGKAGNDFIIYSTLYLENKKWVEGKENVKVGDEVIICGKLTNYNGTLETASKQSYLYSLNGKTK